MNIHPIRSEADHLEVAKEIERLWRAPEGSPEADARDVLATLVDVYESARWAVADCDSVDLLRHAIDDMAICNRNSPRSWGRGHELPNSQSASAR